MKKHILILLMINSLFAMAQTQGDGCLDLPDLNLPDNLDLDNLPSTNPALGGGNFRMEGGWSGNGGDLAQISNNIWFLGSKEISYCVESSDSYGINEEALGEIVAQSLSEWKKFFEKYDMTGNIGRSGRGMSMSFMDGIERGANFNFKAAKDCEGSDLKFFFGKENKVIKEYKKFATEHPYGFALRKGYDHKTYHNQGLVWIKNLSEQAQVKQVVLHELGHVFGMQHDSVYIMRETFAEDLESGDESVGSIETSEWPYRFQVGSSIDLGPQKRKGRRRDLCKENGGFFNPGVNRLLGKIIKVSPRDCLRVELKAQESVGRRDTLVTLLIFNETKKIQAGISGTFSTKRKVFESPKGPGVFTNFKTQGRRGREREVWRKLSLDKNESFEFSGSFKNFGKVMPAKIIQDKGLTLDLFVPGANEWITLKSYGERQ